MTSAADAAELPPETHVGRLALTVADLDQTCSFYGGTLGLTVERDGDRARLTAGGRTVLVLVADPEAPARPRDAAGLFHVAIRVPTRAALADALGRIRDDPDAALTGASDHLVSEALYLQDPEGNGVEVYRDRPRSAWPRSADGTPELDTLPLDLADLSGEATGASLPSDTDVGHVHLEVTDLPRAEAFYVDDLGLAVQARYGSEAAFVAAGGYHHHVGLNVWNRRSAPAGETRGLTWFELLLPDAGALDACERRLADAGRTVAREGDAVHAADPDGIQLRLRVESE